LKTINETTDEHRAAKPQPNQSPSRFLRVLRAFAVKVQPRIHREAAKIANFAKKNTFLPANDFRVSGYR